MLIRRLSWVAFAAIILLPIASVQAQDGADGAANPEIVFCGDAGCSYSPKSGEFTAEDVTIIMGEPDPHGQNTVVCLSGGGCQWSAISAEDADIVAGGDGSLGGEAMIFSEDEVDPIGDEMIFDEDEVEAIDEAVILDLSSIGPTNVIPLAGPWSATHLEGLMTCTGGVSIAIPAGDVTQGELVVSEDGRTIEALDLDPETTSVPMELVVPGVYHGVLEVNADGGTMLLNYDEVFITETFAIGLIYADVSVQGAECHIERRFWTEYTGGEAATS